MMVEKIEKLLLNCILGLMFSSFSSKIKSKSKGNYYFYIYVYKYNQDKSLAISWDFHTFLININNIKKYINGILDGWLGFL